MQMDTGYTTQYKNRGYGATFHTRWITPLATIFFFLFSVSASMGQVIDFGNVTPNDQVPIVV